jgi:hypothetical protein
LEIVDLPADKLSGDALAVPLFADQRPLAGPVAVVDWRLDGAVTQQIIDGVVTGKSGDRLGMQTNAKFAAPRVLLIGGGRWYSLDRHRYETLIGTLLQVADHAGVHELAICLPPAEQADAVELERMVRANLAGTRRLALCRLSRVSGLR